MQGMSRSNMLVPFSRLITQQMHASDYALRGFKPGPDSALCFFDMPMFIIMGMASKARLDSGPGLKPEDTSN